MAISVLLINTYMINTAEHYQHTLTIKCQWTHEVILLVKL